eukprot:CAMPEP_0178455770 /NCGR_PEP_ID=MMETSP0689_2-20121128/46089_1 /TAXON_ID=160604 /ORGANISM="Amphidinium massartii, Strain CS-259" /LENGTH=42 /DNA_ID= /DNA_START= /DNA_END= /DNA_ORIENTATION=
MKFFGKLGSLIDSVDVDGREDGHGDEHAEDPSKEGEEEDEGQ